MASGRRQARIDVQIAPQHGPYGKIRDTAVALEGVGADVLFIWTS